MTEKKHENVFSTYVRVRKQEERYTTKRTSRGDEGESILE